MSHSRWLWLSGLLFAACAVSSEEGEPAEEVESVAPVAAAAAPTSRTVIAEDGRTQYIVRLDDKALAAMPRTAVADARFAARHDAPAVRLVQTLEAVYGVAAEHMTTRIGLTLTAWMTEAQAAAMARDPRVISVEADQYVELSSDAGSIWHDMPGSGSEVISWGTVAVGSGAAAAAARVYILDGGITPNATELNLIDQVNAYCPHTTDPTYCPTGNPVQVACYAHSTHVAGIVGARTNTIGSRGVAAGVQLISVSVLDPRHVMGGCLSDGAAMGTSIQDGLEWIKQDLIAHPTAGVGIVNLSINGGGFGAAGAVSVAMRNAATPAGSYKGVFIAQSAGNFGALAQTYAYTPATGTAANASDGIMVVGSINDHGQAVQKLNGVNGERNDPPAASEPGSDYGPFVDAWAPGQAIRSTWSGGTYRNLSGTSMAAPHVAGLAARLASTAATPGALEAAVRSHLVSLGSVDPAGIAMKMPTLAPLPAGQPYSSIYAELAASNGGQNPTTGQEGGYALFTYQPMKLWFDSVGTLPSGTCIITKQKAGDPSPTVIGSGFEFQLTNQFWTPGVYTVKSSNCPSAQTTITITARPWARWYIDNIEAASGGSLVNIGIPSSTQLRYQAEYATSCNLNLTSWATGLSLPGYPQNNHGLAAVVPLPTANGNYTATVTCTDGTNTQPITLELSLGARVDNSAFVSQTGVPSTVRAGTSFTATITFRNAGNVSWSRAESYNLGSFNPMDNTVWGTGRLILPAGVLVQRGVNASYTGTFTAPATPGTYGFQWQTVRDGVHWFGATSPATSIIVTP